MNSNRRHRCINSQRLALLLCVVLWLSPWLVSAEEEGPAQQLPAISIVIDDMGNHGRWGDDALSIPGKVSYAFLPHTPHAKRLARAAHKQGRDVMLHLPMQAYSNDSLGPGGLTLHQTEIAFKETLASSLESIPHAKGLNNHMGSLLTRHPGAMAWLMQSLQERESLFFIDSRTTGGSVAHLLAREYEVPAASRDVFLDNSRDPKEIKAQFMRLVKKAEKRGYAIGIGHPYPETAQVLNELLANPGQLGVRLISASEMIELQQRKNSWPEPSSPSPKVAKNSKQ
ncbi:MAG: divergent polysaccharide deacetylase family protein [Candidatus Sedimenticola sp. 20ELBAFRAG]